MRRILPLTLLIACAPASGVVDPSDTGPTDPVDDTARLPCDGSWLPELPDRPTGVLELDSGDGSVDSAVWVPELPPSPVDPTSSAFDLRDSVPESVLDRFPLAWPDVPEDPGDQTGALRLEHRFDGGAWQTTEVTRFDDQGRAVAEWYSSSVSFYRWDPDGRSYSERQLSFRERWQPMAQRAHVVGDAFRLTEESRGSLDGRFGEAWRDEGLVFTGRSGPLGSFDDHFVTMAADGTPVRGLWTRWLDDSEPHDYDAEPYRVGAWAYFDGPNLSTPSQPVVLAHRGQTRFRWGEGGSALATVGCPESADDPSSGRLYVWFEAGSRDPVRASSRVFDGAGGWIDREDLDADGEIEVVTTATYDPAANERTTRAVYAEGFEDGVDWTMIETLDDRGVVLTSRTERADGTSAETRRVVVE